jgi:hypothetical protein
MRRFQPQLEGMEERVLLNNRFVVPVGAPVDNVTTFATLQNALGFSGLVTDDVIQIEPGSAPGNVMNADFASAFSGASRLTIKGDTVVGAPLVPQFTISDATTIGAASDLHLVNVNLGLIAAGSLTFNGDGTINGCKVVDISSAQFPFTFGGSTDILSNSTVVNDSQVRIVDSVLRVKTPSVGSNNLISGNTFVSNVSTNAFLAYISGSGSTITDRVVNNSLIIAASSVNFAIVVQEAVSGLTIQNNTISGRLIIGILELSTPQNLKIVGNTLHVTGSGPTGLVGVAINGGVTGTTTSVTIAANVLDTGGNGTGLSISPDAGVLEVSVEGNDCHGDKIGISISAGANSVSGIDLGGGGQGSLGGNNLRSFTAPATSTSGAIVSDATSGTIEAQNNIFGVNNPPTVIQSVSGGTVNATALSANAAFVDGLYEDFLKRPGNIGNALDAGGWVNALDHGASQASVATAIARSAESLGLLVDGLYVRLLGRASDPGGRQGFISLLQGGGTLEQAITLMVTSPEFTNLTGTDGSFVQALYLRLLGRIASGAEVAGWLARIPMIGRVGVANAILGSFEFRAEAVEMLYGFPLQPAASATSVLPDLLDRTSAPNPMDINLWVMSGLDIDTVMVDLASTIEYFCNG